MRYWRPINVGEHVMRISYLVFVAALVSAGPVVAQVTDQQAARNADNWEVFQKFYPPRAIAAHEEGAVGFTVTLDSKGLVTGCQVTHSSGHPRLDQETCDVIAMHAEFKPDSSISSRQVRTHEGLIVWKLPGSTSTLPAPQPVKTSALDKIICKKSIRTGTLADVERTCMTAREWARQADAQKEPWDEMQGRKGSTHGD
jgi:TonB family protein